MTDYKKAAQLLGIPEILIWKMHCAGIIANPLSDFDLRGLAMLSSIWRTEWFLRLALADYSPARRMDLIKKPEPTQVERYILHCYLNAPKGERIMIRNIIGRVDHHLGAKITPKQVRRIRSRAYAIRRNRRFGPIGE